VTLRRPRHVSYSSIREARQVELGTLGKLRIHGSGDLLHWFSYDPDRPHKSRAIGLVPTSTHRWPSGSAACPM
jgi:hypothetical protein